MTKLYPWADVPIRLLMASLFLISGIGKLDTVSMTRAYMASHGVPAVLLWPTIGWEIGAGVAIVIGLWLRPVALLAAGWCIFTGLIFHAVWGDPTQKIQFFKNLVMAGGYLLLARSGAPYMSLDGRRAALVAAPVADGAAVTRP